MNSDPPKDPPADPRADAPADRTGVSARRPAAPVALITGATGPLGRVVTAAFVSDGWRLGLVGTDEGRLRLMADELALPDDAWVPAIADLADRDAAQRAATEVVARFGAIDACLHLVGGWTGGTPVTALHADEISRMLDQHVWTTFHVVQAVVPGMVARGWGRVLAVSSPFASEPTATSGGYALAKASQEVLLRMLAREVAGTGVTVNLVIVKAIDATHQRESAPTSKTAGWTTPEEIAETFRYCCSDGAAAVNGARIPLFGRG